MTKQRDPKPVPAKYRPPTRVEPGARRLVSQRCSRCKKAWPLYDPQTLLGGLRATLRVVTLWWHARRCGHRSTRAAIREANRALKASIILLILCFALGASATPTPSPAPSPTQTPTTQSVCWSICRPTNVACRDLDYRACRTAVERRASLSVAWNACLMFREWCGDETMPQFCVRACEDAVMWYEMEETR